MLKRIFDIFVAAMLAVLLAPVMLGVAILIAVTMGRPVLFIQARPGRDAKPFRIYKFRTMLNDWGSDGMLLPDSERITTLGRALRRSSLDELPELLNVLRGDMSMVGPRPLLMEYLPLYSADQAWRHNVRPGITGWAQVNGRNAITWQQKFEFDVWYVNNRSMWLDIKILLLTAVKVFEAADISQEGQVTVERFTKVHR